MINIYFLLKLSKLNKSQTRPRILALILDRNVLAYIPRKFSVVRVDCYRWKNTFVITACCYTVHVILPYSLDCMQEVAKKIIMEYNNNNFT